MVRIKILEDDPADRDTLIECLRKYEREQGQSFSITAYGYWPVGVPQAGGPIH